MHAITSKAILLVTLVILIFSVAACSRSDGLSSDGRKQVRVFLLLLNTKQVEFFETAADDFEAANPGTDIVIEQFPGSSLKDYEIKIRLRYASNQAPDIWSYRENELAQFVNLDLLSPAPDYIKDIVDNNSVNDLVRTAPYFNGELYGMTWAAGWQALYYNKAMFAEVGLDPEKPPVNWAELLEYADKLTIRDANGNIQRAGLSLRKTGFKPGTGEKWLTFFYSAGGVPFNEDGTKILIDSPAGRATFDFYDEIFTRRIDGIEVEGDQRGFGQGRVAMFIRELHIVDWLNTNYPDIEYGVAAIPPRDSTTIGYSSGGAYPMVVSKTAAHPEIAWRFLEFIGSHERYEEYIRITQDLPVMKSVADLPEFRNNPFTSVFLNQPVYPPPKFAHDRYSLEKLGEYIERFCYGYLTGDEAAARAAEEINGLLEVAYERSGGTD
ncbi:MAG: extracellular solute-binding protein [Rhodothermales bacterium]|nr:extracellular solute-binding protein [Rhodothermales bacterium]